MIVKRQTEPPRGGFATIRLSHRVVAIVDVDDYEKLNQYRWRLYRSSCCYYAARRVRRDGHEHLIKMHRVVAKTPPGYECHHKNHNTLDNRKKNLENLLPRAHASEHGRPG